MSGRHAPLIFAALASLAATSLASAQNVNLGATLNKWGYAGGGKGDSATWAMKGFRIEAKKDKAVIAIGGVNVWLNSAIAAESGTFFIQKRDLDKSVSAILAPSAAIARPIRTIVLDPGHGGKDPGKQNLGLGLNEKTLTFDVVKRIKSDLEEAGYRVLVTRAKDNFVELDDRADFANRNKADLFVSIHFNAADDKSVTGVETYCLTPAYLYSTNDSSRKGADTRPVNGNRNDDANILFAYYVQKSLTSRLDTPDRGVRRARFAVLRDLNCPGVLIESGFLSNTAEAKRIADPVYREARIAKGISVAIAQFHAKLVALGKKR